MSAATIKEDAPPYRVSTPHSALDTPRFIDLFCGIGGFRLAFERAGLGKRYEERARPGCGTMRPRIGVFVEGDKHITRGACAPLFFTLADIIDYHRPTAFVLENVKNHLTPTRVCQALSSN